MRLDGTVLANRTSEDEKPITVNPSEMEGSGKELLIDKLTFHPVAMMHEWVDPENDFAKRLTSTIVLPSGVAHDTVSVSIVDDGCIMAVECAWPNSMLDPQVMFNPWISDSNTPNYTSTHPEVVAMHKSLKMLRMEFGISRHEVIKSRARLQLPFEVEKERIESTIISNSTDKENS